MATQARPIVRSVLPPEANAVQGRRAGVVTRTIVMVIDGAVVAAALGGVYLAWAAARFMWQPAQFSWPTVTSRAVIVAAAIACVLYLTSTWSTTGRSVGMRVLGLRVVAGDGERLHLIRAFLRAVACTFFPVLLYWAAVSRQNRSVHDLVFRTSVIYDWRSRRPGARPTRGAAATAADSPDDAAGTGVDVAPAVADEADDRHAEPLPRLDGE